MSSEDIAALGQFCAQVSTLSAITHANSAPVELWSSYHKKFHQETPTIIIVWASFEGIA